MEIRFTSTLTADDEERVAEALLAALVALLKDLPISYALRIETTGQKVLQQTNMAVADRATESAVEPAIESTHQGRPDPIFKIPSGTHFA